MVKQLFFDDFVNKLEREIMPELGSSLNRFREDPYDKAFAPYLLGILSKYALLRAFKDKSKVFLIDEATLDSLHNVKHTNIDYSKSIKLPFPFIFFEFEKPLSVPFFEGEEKQIKGMFYHRMYDLNEHENEIYSKLLPNLPFPSPDCSRTAFEILACSNEGHFISKEAAYKEVSPCFGISFDINDLPNFLIHPGKKAYRYIYKENKLEEISLDASLPSTSDFFTSKTYSLDTKRNVSMENTASKFMDLSLNLINYINAQNVEVLKVDRDNRHLDAINRKRAQKGKKLLEPIKPYYFIEVKKHYTTENDEPKNSWELGYRIWVRGHFRHYQDGNCIWIDPYIKGPIDAPWKENRYLMLYKNFGHLLKNPYYRAPLSEKAD